MGERVVPEGATAALGGSALIRRDVSCAITGLGLEGSKPVAELIRDGCCGGGSGNGEELSRRGTACAAELGTVFSVAGEAEVVGMGVESNQAGGGNSVAF